MVRYDTGPDNSPYPSGWTIAGPVLWTDYPAGGLSPVPYLDVQTDAWLGNPSGGGGAGTGSDPAGPPSPPALWEPVRRWFGLAGDQTLDPSTGDVLGTAYWAGDLIDSTMAATDATGFAIDYTGGTGFQPVAYSAFGEVLDASAQPGGSAPAGFPRYQYAGGWGYESDLLTLAGANPNLAPITLQHLGWRWYDPATGRFVQRDPIGLAGGTNAFLYAGNRSTLFVDPGGLLSLSKDDVVEILVAGGAILSGIGAVIACLPHPLAKALGGAVAATGAVAAGAGASIKLGLPRVPSSPKPPNPPGPRSSPYWPGFPWFPPPPGWTPKPPRLAA